MESVYVALGKIFSYLEETALKTEPVRRYVAMLKEQMTEIEGKTYPIQVNGKETLLSFTFELLPNDMKYLAS